MKHWFAAIFALALAGCQTTSELVLPSSTAPDAASAQVGTSIGDRLHNFAFVTEAGESASISDFQGKVVFVNFWAAWCRPCREEMPAMNDLYKRVGNRPDMAFLLLQHSEAIDASRAYISSEGFSLPAVDSGYIKGKGWGRKMMTRGGQLERYSFVSSGTLPTSYILDKNGIIAYRSLKRTDWDDFEKPILRLLSTGPA
ncbi:TlpA family protein disulfide reductase [Rhodospirillales bacterium]|nr:TlpA family protein disulfide reductase [Rhodospirillales bacterium]